MNASEVAKVQRNLDALSRELAADLPVKYPDGELDGVRVLSDADRAVLRAREVDRRLDMLSSLDGVRHFLEWEVSTARLENVPMSSWHLCAVCGSRCECEGCASLREAEAPFWASAHRYVCPRCAVEVERYGGGVWRVVRGRISEGAIR